MPPRILSPRWRPTLESFVRPGTLMAFDFDGVLAPIVAQRDKARMRIHTRELLVRVAERFPCIVVSGRQLADLAPRVDGIPLRLVFGNFGHEPPIDGAPPPPIVAQWVRELREIFAGERGIVVEDKVYSVAVHYRHAPHQDRARRHIEEILGGLKGGRVLEGLLAVMVVPRGGPTKGTTLQAARKHLGCDRAIYLGDDGTDESAFASAPPERLLSVKVGTKGPTVASFQIDDQHDVDRLLQDVLVMSTP